MSVMDRYRSRFPGTVDAMERVRLRLRGDRPWDPDYHRLSKRVRTLMDDVLALEAECGKRRLHEQRRDL